MRVCRRLSLLQPPARRGRRGVYEIVLREGGPDDVLSYIDGVLLVDLWDELVLPRAIRSAWQDVVVGTPTSPGREFPVARGSASTE